MRRFVTFCIVVAAGALVAYIGFLSSTELVNPLEQPPENNSVTAPEDVAIEFATTTTHGYEISVRYPTSTAASVQKFIQEDILVFVDTSIEQYESYATRCTDPAYVPAFEEDYPCPPSDGVIVPWQLSIDYEVFNGEESTAYLFNIHQYTGGAHGNGTFKAFSYTRTTGEEIEFRDLVSATEEEAFMESLDRTLRTWFITEGYGDVTFDLGKTLPESGAATFATDQGIGVAFSSYGLGAYTLGTPVVTVPYTTF